MKELDNFRKKYPAYDDVDDTELANMLARKFPDAYGDLPEKVVAETPKNAEEAARSEAWAKKAEEYRTEDPYKKNAQDPNLFQAGAIKFGEGLHKIGTAFNITDPLTPTEQKGLDALEEERPITSKGSEILGEVAPFIGATAAIQTVPIVSALSAAGGWGGWLTNAFVNVPLGALEGWAVAKGEGGNDYEQTAGGVIGGGIALAAETFIPVLGKIAGAAFRRVAKKLPQSNLIAKNGDPTPELLEALKKQGIKYEDLVKEAVEKMKTLSKKIDADQAVKQAQFDEFGIPHTQADLASSSPGGYALKAQENRLIDSAASPASDPLRQLKLDQSNTIVKALEGTIKKSGVSDNVGTAIKKALTSRKASSKAKIAKLYKKAIKEAGDHKWFPIPTQNLSDAMPKERLVREIQGVIGGDGVKKTEGLYEILAEFGIDTSEEALKRIEKKNIKVTPLTLENFDIFRKALNRMVKVAPGQPNHMNTLVGPIKEALDIEADGIAKLFEKSGVPDNVVNMLTDARKAVVKFKKEFNPNTTAERLIKLKGGDGNPVVEASKVYDDIVGTNKPIEFLERTVASLKKSGKQGEQALDNLQAATVTDLIETSLKAHGKKFQGASMMSEVAFANRMAQIGDDKLKLIFSNNAKGYRELKKIDKVINGLIPPSGTIPKGSASVNLDMAFTVMAKVPILGRIGHGAAAIGKLGGDGMKVAKALDAKPELRKVAKDIQYTMPNLASALGIPVAMDYLDDKRRNR